MRVEAVPFARHRSGFTRDFEDLIAFLVTKTDKTTIVGFARVVGQRRAICERVVADGLDPGRLDGLVNIGVDEVSWRKHHRYLTLVTDHTPARSCGAPGKDTATLDAFFDELPDGAAEAIEAISMDMGPAYPRRCGNARPAVICFDPFHVVKLVTDALDVVRREAWTGAHAPRPAPPRSSRAPAGRC